MPANAVVQVKGRFARRLGYGDNALVVERRTRPYDPAEVRAAQEHFGFARPVLVEKDWHILRAMSAIAATDAAPFQLIFSGGTSNPGNATRLGSA